MGFLWEHQTKRTLKRTKKKKRNQLGGEVYFSPPGEGKKLAGKERSSVEDVD